MSRQNISEAFNSLAELEKKQELAKRPVKSKKSQNESLDKSSRKFPLPVEFRKYFKLMKAEMDPDGDDELYLVGKVIDGKKILSWLEPKDDSLIDDRFVLTDDPDYPVQVLDTSNRLHDVTLDRIEEIVLNESLNESSLYDRAMKWFKTHDVRSDMEEACGKKKVNEDFDRDLESKILEMCEEGVLDWEAVARELLREASEDDLEFFCRTFDIDFDLEECNEK